jgi:isoamylase
MNSFATLGRSSPLGATVTDGGVNFSLFSRSATSVELLLFDGF